MRASRFEAYVTNFVKNKRTDSKCRRHSSVPEGLLYDWLKSAAGLLKITMLISGRMRYFPLFSVLEKLVITKVSNIFIIIASIIAYLERARWACNNDL